MSTAADLTGINTLSFSFNIFISNELSSKFSVFSSLISYIEIRFLLFFVQHALYNGKIKKLDDW